MTKSSLTAILLTGAMGLLVISCGGNDDKKKTEITKAAWIYLSAIGDGGWTYAHNAGRLAVDAELQNVETSYVENTPVAEADSEAAIRALAQQGNQIIFTTSFDYMDATLAVAGEFPNVKFEHCSGYKSAANMVTYFGRIEQARYLTGIVAGRKTTTHKAGYVAAYPIPEVFRGINAFALGMRSVDPSAQIYVHWTHTWYDPNVEHAAAADLLSTYNVDVIAQHQDTTEAILAAQAAGKYAVGYDTDMLGAAPDTVLTSAIWHWGPYYTKRVKAVQDGTWTAENYWGGLGDGIAGLGQYGAMVDSSIRTEVAGVQANIESGALNIFAGPINDSTNAPWVAAGSAIGDADQLAMMKLVEGVVETNAQ